METELMHTNTQSSSPVRDPRTVNERVTKSQHTDKVLPSPPSGDTVSCSESICVVSHGIERMGLRDCDRPFFCVGDDVVLAGPILNVDLVRLRTLSYLIVRNHTPTRSLPVSAG